MRELVRQIDRKDPETGRHTRRVSRYARLIGEALGLAPPERRALALAGLLHDLGKARIEDAILNKPGSLSRRERRRMQEHSVLGFRMARASGEELSGPLVLALLHHHERWDGQGYPHRLRGEEIPLLARVVAVADAFDAITSRRPYREARAPGVARDEIVAGSGTQFDPKVVEGFLRAFSRLEHYVNP